MNTKTHTESRGTLHPAARPESIARAGVLAIALVFGGAGAWAAYAPLKGAVIAEGVVRVATYRKSVQSLEGGVITEIRAKDGDRVVAGQVLLMLGDARAAAQVGTARAQLDAALAAAARLRAESEGTASIEFPAEVMARRGEASVAAVLRAETQLFSARARSLREQLELIAGQAAEAREEIAQLEARGRADDAAADLQSQELVANEALVQQGFVSKVRWLQLRRETESQASRRASNRSELSRTRQRLSELRLRAAAMRDDARNAAAAELATTLVRIAQIEASMKPLQDSLDRRRVSAPVAGTVVDSRVHTEGGVVAAGEMLLEIVPDEAPLVVEGRIGVDDITHVREGMPATVRLPAHAGRNAPALAGTVTYVAADRRTDRSGGAEHYVAQVRLEPGSLAVADAMGFRPGMRAEIFVETAERTALEYLAEPLMGSLRRAARQP